MGGFESTPPVPTMPTLAALDKTQTQSPPAVLCTPATVPEIPVMEPSPTAEVPSLTPVVEPFQTPKGPSLTPGATQPQSDEQMQMAHTADGSVDAAVVFRAINYLPPTQVSIPPDAIILRHMGNTGSTWMKRKRGQPRYVGLFTPVMPQGLGQSNPQGQPQAVPLPLSPPPLVHVEMQPPVVDLASPHAKKARSRPPSSSKKQKREALGNLSMEDSPGVKFIPHVIDVEVGQDVASKIVAFSHNGSKDVCILSVCGAISNVTIREPAASGGTANYEGWFEIVSLSGSFVMPKSGSPKRRTGGLSILLAGPNGTVLGGTVAGLLVAASPVQVIIGSYDEEESKETKSAQLAEPSSAPPKFNYGGGVGANSSQLHGTLYTIFLSLFVKEILWWTRNTVTIHHSTFQMGC